MKSQANRFERRPRLALAFLLSCELLCGFSLLEIGTRCQLVELYGPELRRNNSAADLSDDGRPVLLLLGDSFTGDPEGYASLLRAERPDWRVVNAGVSGFTTRQLLRVAPPRLARFRPRVVVIQLYAGNDLLELRHPVDWLRLSPLRNLLWTLSDAGFESPGWLNYRAGQIGDALARERAGPLSPAARLALESRPFSPDLFTPRERLLIAASPWLIESQLLLDGPMAEAFSEYARELSALLRLVVAGEARVFVLIVPHAVQVHSRYRARFEALGARFGVADLANGDSAFGAAVRRVVVAIPGATFVDSLPVLRASETQGIGVYRNNDPHFAPAGHRLLASLLAATLPR